MHEAKEQLAKTLWIKSLVDKPLSREERLSVDQFKKDSKLFLPVLGILKKNKLEQEYFDLLNWAVRSYPEFSPSLVILANVFFERGLFKDMWSLLDKDRPDLKNNQLAQTLLFKTSILLKYESSALYLYHYLSFMNMLSDDTRIIGQTLAVEGLNRARTRLIKLIEESGISTHELNDTVIPQQQDFKPITLSADPSLDSFRVVGIEDIFAESRLSKDGIKELTLDAMAGLLESQGQYNKAMETYQKLLEKTPTDEFYVNKIKELAMLSKQQKYEELMIAPKTMQKLASLSELKSREKYLTELLKRL